MKVIILILVFVAPFKAIALDLPAGWRYPTEKELDDRYRKESKDKYVKTKADYNGDSLIDEVYILVSTTFKGDGLHVYLSTPNGYKWIPLDVDNWDKLYPNNTYTYYGPAMGVGTLSPENTKKYIERKTFDFGNEKPKAIDYRNPSIDYFKFGSAASIFYWSLSESKFKRFWYSD